MIEQNYNLNTIPSASPVPIVHVSQYDKGSRTLKFKLFEGSGAFSVPSGAAVTIRGTKPDGNGFEYTATASGSTVSMDLQQQMATCAGSVRCEVRITSGTQILGTAGFILNVKPSALNENTPLSETELPLIEQAVEGAAKIEANLSASNTAASNAAKSASQAASSATSARASASSASASETKTKQYMEQAAGYAGAASYSFYVKAADGIMYMRYKEGE